MTSDFAALPPMFRGFLLRSMGQKQAETLLDTLAYYLQHPDKKGGLIILVDDPDGPSAKFLKQTFSDIVKAGGADFTISIVKSEV